MDILADTSLLSQKHKGVLLLARNSESECDEICDEVICGLRSDNLWMQLDNDLSDFRRNLLEIYELLGTLYVDDKNINPLPSQSEQGLKRSSGHADCLDAVLAVISKANGILPKITADLQFDFSICMT